LPSSGGHECQISYSSNVFANDTTRCWVHPSGREINVDEIPLVKDFLGIRNG
jgi:hypothetical protein